MQMRNLTTRFKLALKCCNDAIYGACGSSVRSNKFLRGSKRRDYEIEIWLILMDWLTREWGGGQ